VLVGLFEEGKNTSTRYNILPISDSRRMGRGGKRRGAMKNFYTYNDWVDEVREGEKEREGGKYHQ